MTVDGNRIVAVTDSGPLPTSAKFSGGVTDLGGVLVLSEFTGAAIELKEALLVNPHDLNGVKDAVTRALAMPHAESSRRMRTLRRQVLTHDVDRWARSFLDALGLPE